MFKFKFVASNRQAMFFLGAWSVIGFAMSGWLAIHSLQNLRANFRTCALDRSELRAPLWKRLLRMKPAEPAR